MFKNRTPQEKTPQCTCRNTGRCSYCPSIAINATRDGQVSGSGQSGRDGQAAARRLAQRHQ